MTCGNCKAKVEQTLNSVKGITAAVVDLKQGSVTLSMNEHVDLSLLQNTVPPKYYITQLEASKKISNVFAQNEKEESKLKLLKPLFLIIAYIGMAAVLLNYKEGSITEGMLDFMGLFFIVFSFFKLLDIAGFKTSFAMYDPLAKVIPAYGWVYPFIETALGLLFLMRIEIDFALIATVIVLGITTVGVTMTLMSKKTIQCACLGTALKLPMTEATFIENALMIVMALLMLFGIFNF
jgi:copper chaperone CopZ